MSEGGGNTIRGGTLGPWPMNSPSGDLLYSGDTRCKCGELVLSDAHRSFIFWMSPNDMQCTVDECHQNGEPEWRPHGDRVPIPGDGGPSRVAFWRARDGVMVQVHEGEDAGEWIPCSEHTVTRGGLPYSMWVCRRLLGPSDPCDEEFMREISS